MRLKNKSILVDYLNFYTILFIVFGKYSCVYLIYRHKFLNSIYDYFLRFLNVEITYLEINYSSSNYEEYRQVSIEKDDISDLVYSGQDLLKNYLFKKYFYERIHPIVELKVFFGNLTIDRVLMNYDDYFYLVKKEGFYKKVKYYNFPLLCNFKSGYYDFSDVYLKKTKFLFRTYVLTLIKIFRFNFSFSSREPLTFNLLVASPCKNALFKDSFINNSLHAFDELKLDYAIIDPISLVIYTNERQKINHLYSVNFFQIFKVIKGIYKIYKELSTKRKVSLSFFIHLIEKSKDIFFLNKIINDLDVKVVFTCYEGSPIINLLNIIGYRSSKVFSLGATWSYGYMPHFLNELYKCCDIFFTWGDRQNINYIECKSPFRSLVNVGYIGDYAINFMKNKPDDEIEKLKNCGYKVIAVYDNVPSRDHFLTFTQFNNFYRGVLSLLREGSFACVIKTKRLSLLFSTLDKNLLDDILSFGEKVIINTEIADLSPALKSDFTYAFNLSSLGTIASIWGKKTFFYDESGFVNESMFSKKNGQIITNFNDLVPCLKALDEVSEIVDKNSSVDPFVDGNAQFRITEYIQLILSLTGKSKQSIIEEVNIIYRKKYGNDTVIEFEEL